MTVAELLDLEINLGRLRRPACAFGFLRVLLAAGPEQEGKAKGLEGGCRQHQIRACSPPCEGQAVNHDACLD